MLDEVWHTMAGGVARWIQKRSAENIADMMVEAQMLPGRITQQVRELFTAEFVTSLSPHACTFMKVFDVCAPYAVRRGDTTTEMNEDDSYTVCVLFHDKVTYHCMVFLW